MRRGIGARVLSVVAAVALVACGEGPTSTENPTGPRAEVPAGPYAPGASYFGRNQYIEYIAGDLPLIFTAPHGGTLTPAEIPDRNETRCGADFVTGRDTNTQELARAIRAAFFSRTGRYPHIIINRLHRGKLDANRALAQAACGDAEAAVAFEEFHQLITIARNRVLTDHTRGWYTDLHGHGHAVPRLELGYLLGAADLRLPNATLDGNASFENSSSFRTFSQQAPQSFSALLRGSLSLGTLLTTEGFPSVPSAQDPAPDADEAYFTGGYNTATHSCAGGGGICGVQIEANFAGVRDTEANRANFAAALARVYATFLAQNFGIVL